MITPQHQQTHILLTVMLKWCCEINDAKGNCYMKPKNIPIFYKIKKQPKNLYIHPYLKTSYHK